MTRFEMARFQIRALTGAALLAPAAAFAQVPAAGDCDRLTRIPEVQAPADRPATLEQVRTYMWENTAQGCRTALASRALGAQAGAVRFRVQQAPR